MADIMTEPDHNMPGIFPETCGAEIIARLQPSLIIHNSDHGNNLIITVFGSHPPTSQ